MKLGIIADRISAHLKRIEADPAVNVNIGRTSMRRFYHAGAHVGGRFVRVTYVSYQGPSSLTKDAALAYLAWLDAGNNGTHYRQQDEAKRAQS